LSFGPLVALLSGTMLGSRFFFIIEDGIDSIVLISFLWFANRLGIGAAHTFFKYNK
jgi:hypothetical protein